MNLVVSSCQNSETENAFYFFFNLYFQEISLVIHSSLNNILPTDFLFIILTYCHQWLTWLTFRRYFISFSLVMLVDLNQYHRTVKVDKKLTVQFVLILFHMILIQTVSFKNILNLIALDYVIIQRTRFRLNPQEWNLKFKWLQLDSNP